MRDVPRPPVALTAAAARRAILWAQGFVGAPDRRAGAGGVLSRLGAVQLDTISVLARSHELVAYARLGPVDRSRIEQAYWWEPARAFEYWAHAACVLPIDDWPWYAMRRARHERALTGPAAWRAEVVTRLEADGPRTARELGGARQGGPWWDWSPLKRAAEELLAAGRVVCVRRHGWQRVYDLAERAVPARLLDQRPGDEECKVELARRAAAALSFCWISSLYSASARAGSVDSYKRAKVSFVLSLDPASTAGNASYKRTATRSAASPPAASPSTLRRAPAWAKLAASFSSASRWPSACNVPL